MWTCLLLGLITVTAAIFVDSNGDRKLSYESKIEQLERKVKKDKEEIEAWRDIVEKLEEKFHDIRNDKTEALSRKKRGIYGPRGFFVGQPGPRGSPGNPGVPGRIGRRGQKGHKGITGSPGQRGPQGPYGPPGWSGPPGFEGPVGEKGEKGIAGFDGYPGLTGSVGYVGYDGIHGRQGIKGEMGYIGFIGMPGDPGMSGEPGMIGLIGEQGFRGEVGLPGPVGAFGDPGLMGERGPEGPEGLHGRVGQKGERGEPGDLGPWGPVGAPGIIYDPYITILGANALLPAPGLNCTDGENNSTGCSNNYDEYMHAPVVDVGSKSYMPIFAHPPPGAQVVPAEPMYGKSKFVFAPMPADSEINQDIEQQYAESPIQPIDEAELSDDIVDLIAIGGNDTDYSNGYNTTTEASLTYTSDSVFGWYGNVTMAEVGEQSEDDDDDDDSDLDSSDETSESSDDTSDYSEEEYESY